MAKSVNPRTLAIERETRRLEQRLRQIIQKATRMMRVLEKDAAEPTRQESLKRRTVIN